MYKLINSLAFLGCIVWLYVDPSPEPVVVLLLSIAGFFRDDIHGIIGKNVFTLTPKNKLIRDLETARYSFINPEFINPRILDDLTGWISDLGNQVVSINISDSNKSNRYFGDVTVEEISNNYPMVKATFEDGWVSYRYIGHSFSGVHIVQTWSNGGGSGIFCNILLVTLSSDFSIESNETNYEKRTRYVIKLIGSMALGDRYEGKISYKYGFLSIPACSWIKSLRKNKSRVLIL